MKGEAGAGVEWHPSGEASAGEGRGVWAGGGRSAAGSSSCRRFSVETRAASRGHWPLARFPANPQRITLSACTSTPGKAHGAAVVAGHAMLPRRGGNGADVVGSVKAVHFVQIFQVNIANGPHFTLPHPDLSPSPPVSPRLQHGSAKRPEV